jgi:hypothetical protein
MAKESFGGASESGACHFVGKTLGYNKQSYFIVVYSSLLCSCLLSLLRQRCAGSPKAIAEKNTCMHIKVVDLNLQHM